MIEHTGRSIEDVARGTFRSYPRIVIRRMSTQVNALSHDLIEAAVEWSRSVRRYDSLLANDSLNTIKLVMTVALISVVAANVCQPRCEK